MNRLKIEFVRNNATLDCSQGFSIRSIGTELIEFLDVDLNLLNELFAQNMSAAYVFDKYAPTMDTLPMILFGLYDINKDDFSISVQTKEKIYEDIKDIQSRLKEAVTLCLDEDPSYPSLPNLKDLSIIERYYNYGHSIKATIKCNISVIPGNVHGKYEIKETYYPENLQEVIYLFFIKMVVNNVSIKKCTNCGRYFVKGKNYRNEYCRRPIPGKSGKTCQDLGATLMYRKRKKNDQIKEIFDRAYKKYWARRYKYGSITDAEYNDWFAEARDLKEKAYKNKSTPKQFTQWLNKIEISINKKESE